MKYSNINWEEIEEVCATTADLLYDCIPQNIRQWETFIKQYERACDLVNGTWEPHYNWETEEEFNQAVNEQFYLGKGFKHSIYECNEDLFFTIAYDSRTPRLPSPILSHLDSFYKNINWDIIDTASYFTNWNVFINYQMSQKFPILPKKVGGNFNCASNNLTSLEGSPNYVGGNFQCSYNNLTTLKGAPNHVGEDFHCFNNDLTTLEGCPEYVGGHFYGEII